MQRSNNNSTTDKSSKRTKQEINTEIKKGQLLF